MKINFTFTSKEKNAINSFAEACGFEGDVFAKSKTEINDICDQVSIVDLPNGGIVTIDDTIITKLIRFCESKIGTAKMIYHMFKDTIEGYVELMKKNITHRTMMINNCKKQFAENELDGVEYIFCTYTSGMETRYVHTGYEFIIYDDEILEAVLCDRAGMISDDIDEIRALIDEHNKTINKVEIKEETDIEMLEHRMHKEAEFRRNDEMRYNGGKNMIAAFCYYDNEDDQVIKTEHITIIPIIDNEINYDVYNEITNHDHIMLIDLVHKYDMRYVDNIIRWMSIHNKSVKEANKE